jgi:hypothetical protein
MKILPEGADDDAFAATSPPFSSPGHEKTPLNFLQAGRTAGPEQRRGR